jgi:hypothetical protein
MQPETRAEAQARTMTLEAFADTIIPGEKRTPDDRAVAGASPGPGAVAAGAVEVLEMAEGGLAPVLGPLSQGLNGHAQGYAAENGLDLDDSVPPFVALSFVHRTALVARLTAPDSAEKEMWVPLAMFSNMAFDTAAHMHTVDAVAAGHPGLTMMGFAAPDADGLWRFPAYSYRRQLAELHPGTTASGSPA